MADRERSVDIGSVSVQSAMAGDVVALTALQASFCFFKGLYRMQDANAGRIARIEAEQLLDEYFARIETVLVNHYAKGD
jgi:hypothetical protein